MDIASGAVDASSTMPIADVLDEHHFRDGHHGVGAELNQPARALTPLA
jgi:hypothetical protein